MLGNSVIFLGVCWTGVSTDWKLFHHLVFREEDDEGQGAGTGCHRSARNIERVLIRPRELEDKSYGKM